MKIFTKIIIFLVVFFVFSFSALSQDVVEKEIPVPVENFTTLPPENVVGKEENNPVYFLIFLFIIGVGVGGVYFVRKNKGKSEIGDDFEILEG